ncbi:MAG: RNA polymerase sigma factor [Faecousia sp.]
MEAFEAQLKTVYPSLERYVKYRLDGSGDAEDLIQDVCLTAYLKYGQLQKQESFKAWILSIARNRCRDYFRRKEAGREVPLEEIPESKLVYGRMGLMVSNPVEETMELLTDRDREVLRLFYWQQLSLAEIAQKLNIPTGTVKSRLNTARERFRKQYPHPPKGDHLMTKLPNRLPEYTIEKLEQPPFSVKWEELQGWQIVPRLGEKLSWGLYDWPSRRRTEYTDLEVIGKAEIHGIEGVEILAVQYGAEDYYRTGCVDKIERRFIARLTDTHSQFLAESHVEDGVRKCYTFLDGDEFLNNWGFGEDNCGNAVKLVPKGLLKREGNTVTGQTGREVVDVVGRYQLTINGKTYDTVCVMDIQCFNDAVASEQYIDQNGRTVLWRRFNRDDWAIDRFGGRPWSEKLPGNQRLDINGQTFVHWYDCVSDYIL